MKKIQSIFTTDKDRFDRNLEELINDGYTILSVNSSNGDGKSIKYHFFAVLCKEV